MQYRENTECIVCVYDDVWGIYSGEYISKLYVRGRPHVHLIIELEQEKQKKAKHELETVQKEKQKITNELEEKVVEKAKSK